MQPRLPLLRIAGAGLLLLCLPFLVHGAGGAADPVAAGGPAVSAADQRYLQARTLIAEGQYAQALHALRTLRRDVPDFPARPALDARIAVLHEAPEAGASLAVYIEALDLRDRGDTLLAIERLDDLLQRWPRGTLADDALYLIAYLQLMDRYDYAAARRALQQLFTRVPDSAYADSARYLDAIALEQSGQTAAAREHFEALLDRHTAMQLPFGFRWPIGTVLSRYWFERTERRLAMLDAQADSASAIEQMEHGDQGGLRLTVNVGGVEMTLDLRPGSLTYSTGWLDSRLRDRPPPAMGIYAGRVVGAGQSWARVVISNGAVSGMVEADGQRYRLQPGDLVGTLDYYQPRRRAPLDDAGTLALVAPAVLSDDGASRPPASDALLPPPDTAPAPLQRRAAGGLSDVRLVPLSLMVDSQFDRYYAGTGLARALEQLNVADGIYRQFGLALAVDQAVVVGADRPDPFALGPVTLETSLRAFRDYRLANRSLFGDSALTYLFTGNPRSDNTLGLAWIDTLCRTDGYDVGVTTPNALGDLLLTHELGHSLGAPHDTDTECRSDTDRLMWPEISTRTQLEFSDCSNRRLAGARQHACLLDAVDLSMVMRGTGDAVEFTLSNPDSQRPVAATLTVESSALGAFDWPSECRVTTPGSADCALASLAPGESRYWQLPLAARASDQRLTVSGQLRPEGVAEINAADNLARLIVEGDQARPVSTADTQLLASLQWSPVADESGSRTAVGRSQAAPVKGASGWWWLAVGIGGWLVRSGRRSAVGG